MRLKPVFLKRSFLVDIDIYYILHIKVKKNRYWFKPKRYGWGCCPVTWEGWLAILVLFGILGLICYKHGGVVSSQNSASFLFDAVVVIVVAHLFIKHKTKGRLRWRWGR